MPWVRIDENAMDHPKFVAISANAWRLWCEGQSYCQKHLTDGVIPRQVLKGFRYYSPASLKMLTDVLVPGKTSLWEVTDSGVQVHDYCDWNDSREMVLKARQEAKERRRRWRDGHASMNASGDASLKSDGERPGTRSVLRGVVCSERSSGGESAREGPPSSALARRAGDFVESYRALHRKYLRGAEYVGPSENFDYLEAVKLCRIYDDDRLAKLATVWLNMDDDFAMNGTRTLAKFRSRASKCDELLRERGL